MYCVLGLNNKKYENLVADNYLCVPTVLEIILKSENVPNFDKYMIANYFGVVLPQQVVYSQISNYSHSEDSIHQGITLKRDSINNFFKKNNIPLKEHFVWIKYIDRDFFSDFIYENLISGKHIICGYEYNTLYKKTGKYAGHVSIITTADPNKDVLCLLDPGPNSPGLKTISAQDLYYAILRAKDGLWVISNIREEG